VGQLSTILRTFGNVQKRSAVLFFRILTDGIRSPELADVEVVLCSCVVSHVSYLAYRLSCHLVIYLFIWAEIDPCCEGCGQINQRGYERTKQLDKAAKRRAEFETQEEIKRLKLENEALKKEKDEREEDERLAEAARVAERNALRNAEAEERRKLKERVESQDVGMNEDDLLNDI
jgi:hypothetical protein